MSERVLELLPEYVLGTLSPDETAEVEAALDSSPSLAAEARAIGEAFDAMAAALPPVQPKSETKERLFQSLRGADRFLPFLDDLAGYFDLAAEKVRSLLALIDDPGAWKPGPVGGIRIIDFPGGPNAFAPDTGFVYFPAGLEFPYHQHRGPELTYVLQGAIEDEDGTVYRVGEALFKDADTPHAYRILDEEDCIIAIAQVGFDIVEKP